MFRALKQYNNEKGIVASPIWMVWSMKDLGKDGVDFFGHLVVGANNDRWARK
jgi:hypothetical protein